MSNRHGNEELLANLSKMTEGLKGLQDNILASVEDAYKKMSPAQAEQFIKALKDGGLDKIAKENADRIVAMQKK